MQSCIGDPVADIMEKDLPRLSKNGSRRICNKQVFEKNAFEPYGPTNSILVKLSTINQRALSTKSGRCKDAT